MEQLEEKKSIFKRIVENNLLMEIFRYLIVGGLATIVDWAIYYLFQNIILPKGDYSYYVATSIGFIFGLVFNYFLSIIFVFKNVKDKKKSRSFTSFLIFVIIGVIGLGFTELGMFIGHMIFKENFEISIVNLDVRCFMTVIVLIWNYLARKITIFK